MRRAILRYALSLATQTRNHARVQRRYVHQDLSSSPHQKNVTISSSSGDHTQNAPININHFKALFRPQGAYPRKKYRLRWDWHLRNFLTALVPPAALFVCIKLIEWGLGGTMEEHAHLFPANEQIRHGIGQVRPRAKEQGTRKDLKASLNAKILERLEQLEKDVHQLRSQRSASEHDSRSQQETSDGVDESAIAKARRISKMIVRPRPDPS